MEIISKSKYWSCILKCQCTSKLEIEKEDIYVKVGKEHNKYYFYYTFRCPCCNIESNIDELVIPIYIKISALSQFKGKIFGNVKVNNNER